MEKTSFESGLMAGESGDHHHHHHFIVNKAGMTERTPTYEKNSEQL